MGGNFHLKLNTDPRPIANKYREGKVKRTLERGLKVPEIAKREANETSFCRMRLLFRFDLYFILSYRQRNSEFNWVFKPSIFLLISLFSVTETSLKFFSRLEDFISC